MELAALGTPDMPLNKPRVPRQAATAAKAAIKKDLLKQSSRSAAASVPAKAGNVMVSAGKNAVLFIPAPTHSQKKQPSKSQSLHKHKVNSILAYSVLMLTLKLACSLSLLSHRVQLREYNTLSDMLLVIPGHVFVCCNTLGPFTWKTIGL